MNDLDATARAFATNAMSVLTSTGLFIAASSFFPLSSDTVWMALWLLTLAAGTVAIILSAHLLFDALLFRFMASFEGEPEACRQVDDLLERMHLRQRPASTRPLAPRLAGTRTLMRKQRIAFGIFLVLLAMRAASHWNG